MKSKKTKKALSGSVLALVLCFVMLIGTTFAWFTSSDSTAVNKIEAGELKVELQKKSGESWVDVGEDALSFNWAEPDQTGKKILWEPGATYALPELRIVNKGNLALKYKVVVSGINGDEKLNEVIDWTISDANNGKLGANAESGSISISATMRTSAGNAYQGLSIESAAITVYATQDTVEYDSNTNEYDKDATLPEADAVPVATEAALDAALENGGSAYMTTDLTVSNTKTGPGTNTVKHVAVTVNGGTLDGGANNLGIANTTESAIILTSGGTIKNVTLSDGAVRGIFIQKPTQDVILEGVTISGPQYPINTGNAAGTTDNPQLVKLIASNSVFNGWTSFANIESASFTDCSFGTNPKLLETRQENYNRLIKPFVNTTFTNCEFEVDCYLDLSALGANCKVSFKDCTLGGVTITADNCAELFGCVELPNSVVANSNTDLSGYITFNNSNG